MCRIGGSRTVRYTIFKRLRQEKNLLQVELQLRTHIARCRLSAIENGYVTPTQNELLRISKALDVPVEALQQRSA